MRSCKFIFVASSAAVLCALTVSQAQATLITYDVVWSGAPLGNAATITGTITLDTDRATANYVQEPIGPGGIVTNVLLNVSGSTTPEYNGVFGNIDFAWGIVTFNDYAAMDWDQDLLTQAAFGEVTFDGANAAGRLSPSYSGFRELAVGSGGSPTIGERVTMDSFGPVPEPSSFVLAGIAALGSLAWVARRRVIR